MTLVKPIDVNSEREFHNKRFQDGDNRQEQQKYYWAIQQGAKKYWDSVELHSKGTAALSYGCGPGDGLSSLLPHVKSLDGIDISDVAIENARENFSAPSIRFHVMDAMNFSFVDESFDLVFGSGIIHHLDVRRSCQEICRVLKVGGKAIFWEPLGMNPIINAYRYVTPSARTADEHPLLQQDIKTMSGIASSVEIEHFGLLTLLAMPFYRQPFGIKLLPILEGIDKALLKVQGVRLMAWYSLITLTK